MGEERWGHPRTTPNPPPPTNPPNPQGMVLVIWVNIVQTEITMEICSKVLIRAIGYVLFMGTSLNFIKHAIHEGGAHLPLFVNKWHFCESPSDDNNNVLIDLLSL